VKYIKTRLADGIISRCGCERGEQPAADWSTPLKRFNVQSSEEEKDRSQPKQSILLLQRGHNNISAEERRAEIVMVQDPIIILGFHYYHSAVLSEVDKT